MELPLAAEPAYGAVRVRDRTESGTLSDEARAATRRGQAGHDGERVETIEFPRGSSTDAALVRAARSGDAAAFETLVRRHLKAAHSVALSRVSDPQDAEDVCQDAFITALEKLDACQRPEHFRAWFLTIVRNRAHNVRKYQEVRGTQPLEHAGSAANASDPGRDADRARLRERLSEALGQLTHLQRQVVLKHDYEGWKHQEIGDQLGISAGASRFHLHAARRRLRKLLEDLGPGEPR